MIRGHRCRKRLLERGKRREDSARKRNKNGEYLGSSKRILTLFSGMEITDPLGFQDFLVLEANAALILTDSGGVQEEACILRIPCVTLRDNTERPETIEVGGNILAGTNPSTILSSVERILSMERDWANPFGDGQAGFRIVETICETQKAKS